MITTSLIQFPETNSRKLNASHKLSIFWFESIVYRGKMGIFSLLFLHISVISDGHRIGTKLNQLWICLQLVEAAIAKNGIVSIDMISINLHFMLNNLWWKSAFHIFREKQFIFGFKRSFFINITHTFYDHFNLIANEIAHSPPSTSWCRCIINRFPN